MSRHRFGTWGIELDEVSFAEALAGAALKDVSGGVAELEFDSIPPPLSPSDARANWRSASAKRIEVRNYAPLDLLWLNATLGQFTYIDGVYFRRDEPDASVAWEWPLRIGLLEGGERNDELRSALENTVLAKLVRFVSLSESVTECELLLIPCNLRAALERVLAAPARITADCVIVLGGAKVESDRAEALVQALRTEVRTGGVAVASVPKELRALWMRTLVAELAHNYPIDHVLRKASNGVGAEAPLVVCSRKLTELARVARYVQRVGAALKSVGTTVSVGINALLRFGATVTALPDILMSKAESYRYDHETDETTAIIEVRESVEKATNEPLAVPRMSSVPSPNGKPKEEEPELEIAPPSPTPTAAPPERFVRADFWQDENTTRYADVLDAQRAYWVRVRIAPPGGGGATANVAFDETKLPPSTTGHDLTIALFELRDSGHEPASPSTLRKIHLPPNRGASSDEAWFPIITPKSGAFVARVVVLHETRVLQTLLLRAPVAASQDAVTLKEENVIRPTFEDLGSRRAFDAALVVNESDGVPAVMAMTSTSAVYKEPVDARAAIDKITEAVNELTRLADTSDITIDDEDVVSVLITLAEQGNLLSRWISRNLPAEIASANRVQILEARAGAYLPLEFVYPSYTPEKTATICPHGKAELANPQKTKCPNERNRNFVCPAVFWGFSRVLERFPHPAEATDAADYRLSTPKPSRSKIDPFESALIAASKKVRIDDMTGANGIIESIKPLVGDVFTAANWDDWSTEIEKHSPSMLLLFPHSEEVDSIQALEVGDKFLKLSYLEKEYVRRDDRDPGPIVLLLGCSTTLPRIRFHSFVAEFRALGASIVVGTLSLIRGRHATRFVKEFVAALKKRAGTQDAVFGDVLLDAKRSMLAAGDPFALTLVAYGDADWRL